MQKLGVVRFVLLYVAVLTVGRVLAQSPDVLSFKGNGQLTWSIYRPIGYRFF